MILVEEEFKAFRHWFYERFSASNELMAPWRDLVLFQIWRDARIGIMKSVPENIWLAKDLFRVSLEHRVPRSPTWRAFRAGQRSAAATAQDPVSTEADGRCPWQVTVTGPRHGNRFDHTWGGISWPFSPTLLGMLSGEDFIDKHSVCYYWTSTVQRSLYSCLLVMVQENIPSYCIFP